MYYHDSYILLMLAHYSRAIDKETAFVSLLTFPCDKTSTRQPF